MNDFDVDSYSRRYRGRNLVLRLKHVASVTTGDVQLRALRLAFDYIQETCSITDMTLYREISDLIDGRLGEAYRFDELFSLTVNNAFVVDGSFFRNDWQNCEEGEEKEKLALILDSLYYSRGEYKDSEDPGFSLRPYRLIKTSMLMILIGIENRQYDRVRYRSFCQLGYYGNCPLHRFKMNCANALADLGETRLFEAAQGFINLIKEATETLQGESVYGYPELLSLEDVVTYGLICGMSSFGQSKYLVETAMNTQVLDPVLGGVTSGIQNIISPHGAAHKTINFITEFLAGHFSVSLALLQNLTPLLRRDIYLFPQMEVLCNAMRDCVLAAYVKSFSVLLLDSERVIGGLVISETDVNRLLHNHEIHGHIEVTEAGLRFFHTEIIEEIIPPPPVPRAIQFVAAQNPD